MRVLLLQAVRLDLELHDGAEPEVVVDDLVLIANELCDRMSWVYDVDELNSAGAANRAYKFVTSELLSAVVEVLTSSPASGDLFQSALYFLLRLAELLEAVWPQDVVCRRTGMAPDCAVALRAFYSAVLPALPVLISLIGALPRRRSTVTPLDDPADPDSVALVYQLMAVPVLIAAVRDPSNEDSRRSALRAGVGAAIAHALFSNSVRLRVLLFDAVSVLAQSPESVAVFCSPSLRIMPLWLALLDHCFADLKLSALRALQVFFRGYVRKELLSPGMRVSVLQLSASCFVRLQGCWLFCSHRAWLGEPLVQSCVDRRLGRGVVGGSRADAVAADEPIAY